MQNIAQVSCSLNLGLIYSLDYSYSPNDGIGIKIFFFNQDGNYPTLTLLPLQKAFIKIGNASFSMYPVATEIELANGRRVMSVDFVDEFYQLRHYYVALPNRGCGANIFTLGAPVDSRTLAQKQAAALDSTAVQIQDLTQYPDYEYSFNDFLNILRTKFNVQITAVFDNTITQAFEGSFETVLKDWCDSYNFSFFFENGIIKIFNPSTLTIALPPKPPLAISYNVSQDIRSTYGKNVCNWYQQDGGEYPLSQTSNADGNVLVRTNTLYPAGYELGLDQVNVPLDQVAAAQYGREYWFLYNYYKGSLGPQCGWTPVSSINITSFSGFSVAQSLLHAVPPLAAVAVNENVGDINFEAYVKYGQDVAGRWYLSNRANEQDIAIDQSFTWFSEVTGPIVNFTGQGDKAISPQYLIPGNLLTNVIDGTPINQAYSGVNYVGDRTVLRDDTPLSTTFILGSGIMASATPQLVLQTYQSIFNVPGADAVDFSQITIPPGYGVVSAYNPITIPQNISQTFASLSSLNTVFQPRYTSIPIKGVHTADYTTLKSSQTEPTGISIVNGSAGGNVVSNTSVLKTLQQGSYTVYYDKYAQCASAATPDLYYDFKFEPRQISTDNQLTVTFSKKSNNTYNLNRDYNYINGLVNNPLLPTLAQARVFATERVTFTLNYFYDVPTSFLTNGLIGMSISVGDNGIRASYAYSNEVLRVPDRSTEYNRLAQCMKNTWTRTYRPKEVIA